MDPSKKQLLDTSTHQQVQYDDEEIGNWDFTELVRVWDEEEKLHPCNDDAMENDVAENNFLDEKEDRKPVVGLPETRMIHTSCKANGINDHVLRSKSSYVPLRSLSKDSGFCGSVDDTSWTTPTPSDMLCLQDSYQEHLLLDATMDDNDYSIIFPEEDGEETSLPFQSDSRPGRHLGVSSSHNGGDKRPVGDVGASTSVNENERRPRYGLELMSRENLVGVQQQLIQEQSHILPHLLTTNCSSRDDTKQQYGASVSPMVKALWLGAAAGLGRVQVGRKSCNHEKK